MDMAGISPRRHTITYINVITAYRVCKEPPKESAMTTAWHQQQRALLRQKIRTDPRERFLVDLRKFLLKLKEQDHHYIVGWDANASHLSDDVFDLLDDTDMVDGFTDFFSSDSRPGTHQRGSEQIDQISLSYSLSEYIANAFILDPSYGEGDHSYIGIDLNLGAILNRESVRDVDPTHHQNRILVSKDVKGRTAYLKHLKKMQNGQNIPDRMRRLFQRCASSKQCTDSDRKQFQAICKQMYANAKQAEASCKKVGRFSWSRMLASAGCAAQLANKRTQESTQRSATRSDKREPGIINRTSQNKLIRSL